MKAMWALAVLLTLPAADARTLAAQLHDNPLHLAPERMTAAVNETVTIEVMNRGKASHDFLVCSLPADGGCSRPLAFTPLIAPGKAANVTFTPAQAGEYEYYCKVPGHKEGGMRGTLYVGLEPEKDSPALPLLAVLAGLCLVALVRRR